jgi:cytochrome d ubiquinol oxidase subunit II
LVATLIFLPAILIYTAIVFRALRGVVTASFVEKNSATLY